jgi:hypothetical protein
MVLKGIILPNFAGVWSFYGEAVEKLMIGDKSNFVTRLIIICMIFGGFK